MDESEYQRLRDYSAILFNNRLVLPVACAVLRLAEVGASVAATEIRRELGGRVENNQIRDALKRLAGVGALRELPHAGPPSPHSWVRQEHPLWPFVKSWTASLLSAERR